MNAKVLEEFIKQNKIDLNQFIYEGNDELVTKRFGEYKTVFDDRVRGSGDFDTWRIVLYFKNSKVHIAFDGHYDSNEGTDWEYAEPYDVKPVEKTITVYEAFK